MRRGRGDPMVQPAFRFGDLTSRYGERAVLGWARWGYPRCLTALIGPNGSGKKAIPCPGPGGTAALRGTLTLDGREARPFPAGVRAAGVCRSVPTVHPFRLGGGWDGTPSVSGLAADREDEERIAAVRSAWAWPTCRCAARRSSAGGAARAAGPCSPRIRRSLLDEPHAGARPQPGGPRVLRPENPGPGGKKTVSPLPMTSMPLFFSDAFMALRLSAQGPGVRSGRRVLKGLYGAEFLPIDPKGDAVARPAE